LGALAALQRDPEAVIACLPADQMIGDIEKFRKVLRAGLAAAKKDEVHVTFGIPPSAPETGFGYIERSRKIKVISGVPVYQVKRFAEKPSLQKAKRYLASGKFYWNSGIFIWKASFLIDALRREKPGIIQKLCRIADGPRKQFQSRFRKIYPSVESISIDYALMERASNVRVIPGDFGWSDIGSWSAFEKIWSKDSSGNAVRGKVISVDSAGNIVDGDSKLVALVGIRDLVVVSTDDAMLIARKDQVQDVRKVIDILKREKLNQYL
ncbi:MAG: mannose-1-phosphate guanylyltransferase, partial [Candidatus Omnitrophica bacterium]|nr:mannose-1-phosphate guanylyltransferase [Candidatus Omnitrophota bacterium]